MKIYLIKQSSGSYDDYCEYIEKGFFDKRKAEDYIKEYNEKLVADRELSIVCDKCNHGRYETLADVLLNCPVKARKIDITEMEKLDGDIYFDCEKASDYYDVHDQHFASIQEIEVE